jgi:signal transduction histidine kinase
MTLVTRLSLFFLAALAVVLAGFSGALYVLTWAHLHRQAAERAGSALDTLAAAVEHEPGGLEWEAHERRLPFGAGGPGEAVSWEVTDDGGRRVDGSPDGPPDGQADGGSPSWHVARRPDGQADGGSPSWHVARRHLQAEPPAVGRDGPPSGGPKRYRALTLTAAVPLGPVDATLRRLAVTLVVLSGGVWLSAAVAGRRLSRRGLRPLADMARAARTITAADERLPSPGTGDELADLGGAFNDLLARLQESFERQRRFTGDASHQLRTPLAGLLGQVEVALRRDRDPEEYRRVLRAVQGQAGQLRAIVEALLFLARADAEARTPERERIDLGGWLDRHLESWSGHPRADDLRREPGPGGPLPVRAQPALLGQAVDNLLDNACKYSAPGSPITLRPARQGDWVSLAVADRGPGIAAGDLPRVFEPFYRSPRAGPAGVGLGLAVAARVVAALGGRIEVQSEPGTGSTFTLLLPADPPPAEDEIPPG